MSPDVLKLTLPHGRDRVWLVALFLAMPLLLLPTSRLFMFPHELLSLVGIYFLVRERGALWRDDPGMRAYLAAMLALWLPMLFSAVDTVAPAESWLTTLLFPLFALAGVGVIALLRKTPVYGPVYAVMAIALAFCAVDATLQTVIGRDFFGIDLVRDGVDGHRASSLFYSHPNKFGFYMGMFGALPLYVLHAWGARRHWHIAAMILLFTGALVGGSRDGWLMFGWAFLPYFYLEFLRGAKRPWLPVVLALVMAPVAFWGVMKISPGVQERFKQSSRAGQLDYRSVNDASSGRIDIWIAAARMGLSHPVNGVGVGAFRKVFQNYLPAQSTWPQGLEALHPHQVVLEIWAGSGVPGLAGFGMVWILAWRLCRSATTAQRRAAWPALIAAATLWWPLNTHRAFYGSELTTLTLFLLSFAFAALTARGGAGAASEG